MGMPAAEVRATCRAALTSENLPAPGVDLEALRWRQR
ncbi:hypothetical protein JOF40_002561 [Aeromicrobium fastidiosum]|nr:hypothetical protein [Aeromicrobium fastidiosum]